MKRLSGLALLLMLTACASGPRGHPHGYGHRDSPGRPAPTAVPMPGYEYRFRPDPQGLGRDMPALQAWGPALAHVPSPAPPCGACAPGPALYGFAEDAGYSERSVIERRESRSTAYAYQSEVYIDHEAAGSTTARPYLEEVAPYTPPPSSETERPYVAPEPSSPGRPRGPGPTDLFY